MAKEFKYIDTAGAEQRITAPSGEDALKNATNIAPTSGVMAVDTLSRQADPRVNREVELVNQAQNQQPSNALTADIANATATPAPIERPQAEVSTADQLAQEIAGTDLAGQRQQIREDKNIRAKEERARTLGNQLTERDREIQRQRERMEENLRADSRGGLESQLAKFNRESARELADLSFSYQVALGDFQAAEKIANDYIQDLESDFQRKQQTWQMLFTMEQNDMTDSEKLQAQQAFQEKQAATQFEMQQKMVQFEQQIKQSDPMYQAQLARLRAESAMIGMPTVAEQKEELARMKNAETTVNALADKIDMFDGILSSKAMDSSVGTSFLTRGPSGTLGTIGRVVSVVGIPSAIGGGIDKLTGERQNFIASVEQITDKEFLDTLIDVKSKGGTFGALSDAEGAALRKAATKIGQWRIEKDGKVVGYNASETDFKKEITRLKELTNLAMYRAQGDLFTDDEKALLEQQFVQFNPEAYYSN